MSEAITPVLRIDAERTSIRPPDAGRVPGSGPVPPEASAPTGSSAHGSPDARRVGVETTYAEFHVDPDSEIVQFKLISEETGDVILQVPPEVILKLAAQLKEQIKNERGVVLDARR